MSQRNKSRKSTTLAIGAAFVATLAASHIANAASPAGENPFAMTKLHGGYTQLAAQEGKCGEGKCGGSKKSDTKSSEGKCGGDKGAKKDKQEGKCGEGKCGGKK